MSEAKRLLDIEVKAEREERRNRALLDGSMDTDDTGNSNQKQETGTGMGEYCNNVNKDPLT